MAELESVTWTCPACGEKCEIELDATVGVSAYDVVGIPTVRIYPHSNSVVQHQTSCQKFAEKILAGEAREELLLSGLPLKG